MFLIFLFLDAFDDGTLNMVSKKLSGDVFVSKRSNARKINNSVENKEAGAKDSVELELPADITSIIINNLDNSSPNNDNAQNKPNMTGDSKNYSQDTTDDLQGINYSLNTTNTGFDFSEEDSRRSPDLEKLSAKILSRSGAGI